MALFGPKNVILGLKMGNIVHICLAFGILVYFYFIFEFDKYLPHLLVLGIKLEQS